MLQEDVERAFGTDSGAREPPTVTLDREALLGLLDQSTVVEPPPRPHIVPRAELKSRAPTRPVPILPAERPKQQLDDAAALDLEWPEGSLADVDPDDIDLTPSISPLVLWGVLGLLLAVFIAITRMN